MFDAKKQKEKFCCAPIRPATIDEYMAFNDIKSKPYDYVDLANLPKINGVEVVGKKSLSDFGIKELVAEIVGNEFVIRYK